jgi:hypothetical protein
MRAQLIELTAESAISSRKAWSLNMAFTRSWQSSKLPSMAMLCTLAEVAVVIWRRCTSETRGGADDGDPLAARGEHVVEQAADHLQGIVLEGQGRAVEQLQEPEVAVELLQGRHGGVAEAGIGLAASSASEIASPTKGRTIRCASWE